MKYTCESFIEENIVKKLEEVTIGRDDGFPASYANVDRNWCCCYKSQ